MHLPFRGNRGNVHALPFKVKDSHDPGVWGSCTCVPSDPVSFRPGSWMLSLAGERKPPVTCMRWGLSPFQTTRTLPASRTGISGLSVTRTHMR